MSLAGGVKGLYKKGLYLEYFTVGYNIIEAAASIVFGSIAGSIALIAIRDTMSAAAGGRRG